MTRSDYRVIALAIGEAVARWDLDGPVLVGNIITGNNADWKELVVDEFCIALLANNPRFNDNMFRGAVKAGYDSAIQRRHVRRV